MNKQLKQNLAIYSAYLLITCMVTYPAIIGVLNPYTIPGEGGDSRYFLWHLWWIKQAILNLGTWPTFTHEIFYPTGGVLFLASPFSEALAVTIQPLWGLTQTYTILWLFSYCTTGYTTYLLGYHCTHNRVAAFIGGLIFAFSARHYAHAAHVGLWTTQWLPLYLLALFLLLQKPTAKRAVFTAFSFILAVSSEHVYHVFYFIVPVTGVFVLFYGLTTRPSGRFWLALGGALVTGGLLLLPLYFHLLPNRNQTFIQGGGKGVIEYSADLLAYVTPPRDHPFWWQVIHQTVVPNYASDDIAEFVYNRFQGSVEEDTVFIGYTALILMGVGLVSYRKKRDTYFWIIFGSGLFIFSLGPLLHIYGPITLSVKEIETYVPLPYIFLTKLPLIGNLRAPARLAVGVQLTVAILATYGVAQIVRFWAISAQIGLLTVIGGFILCETLYQFPFYIDQETLLPNAIYEQIAQNDNNLAVLELPARRVNTEEIPTKSFKRWYVFYYMYYATIHQQPLVGGEAARTPPESGYFLDTTAFIRELTHPSDLTNPLPDIITTNVEAFLSYGGALLAKHNIGYVILHEDRLEQFIGETDQNIPELLARQSLGEPFYDKDGIIGFTVPHATPPIQLSYEAVMLGDGWYPRQAYQERSMRWMGETATLLLYTPITTNRRLTFEGFPAMVNPLTVSVLVDGLLLDTIQLVGTSTTPATFFTSAFTLAPGLHEIKLRVEPDGTPIDPIHPKIYAGSYGLALQPVLSPSDITPQYTTDFELGGTIKLIGYDQNQTVYQPNDILSVNLYWHALIPPENSYKLFLHVIDADENIVLQQDSIPHQGQLPTTLWGQDELIPDPYNIAIPPETPVGTYQLRVGLYDAETFQRLPIEIKNQTISIDYIDLAEIKIE